MERVRFAFSCRRDMVMQGASFGRLVCIVALVVSAVSVPLAASVAAQKAGERKAKSVRLPNYYAQVASGQQREQLREVMKDYAPQIQAKREELQALIAKRDAALDELLTAEQREELKKLRAEAAQRRKAGSAGKEKAEKGPAPGATTKKAA